MIRKTLSYLSLVFVGLSLIAVSQCQAYGQNRSMSRSGKEIYRGNIVYIGGGRGNSVDFFTLTIDSYTPESDVQQFLSILKSGGQDDLKRVIGNQKRGTIQVGNGLSRDLDAIWITQTDEGRKITAIGQRWVGFSEIRRSSRSLDYPFTYVELYLEDDGKADGSLIPAARLRSKGGKTIEVEDFGIYPAKLSNIKQTRK